MTGDGSTTGDGGTRAVAAGAGGPDGRETRHRGAEALLEAATTMGRPALAKRRIAKGYRHGALDARLRDERTRDEAGLLLWARRAGVPVPVVYDVDRAGTTIVLEQIEGETLRQALARDTGDDPDRHLQALGAHVARLHDAGLTHGDLTTSNILVRPDGGLVLVDFGLGHVTAEHEAQAVDLHLLEEALEATHAEAGRLFSAFLEGYQWPGRADTLRRLDAIRRRGRYR